MPWLAPSLSNVFPITPTQFGIVKGIEYFGYIGILYDLRTENWGSAAAGIIGLQFPGVILIYSVADKAHDACVGSL